MSELERKFFESSMAYVFAREAHPESAKGHFRAMLKHWKEIIRANRCSTPRQETN